jgi:hypothetical protein
MRRRRFARKYAVSGYLTSLLFAIVAFFAVEGSASAYFGFVQGSFYNWNQNGNYCPTGATCTGSRYFQSTYNAWEPVRNILVNVYRASDNAFIGQGVTNDIGDYTVYWYSASPTTSAYVDFYAWQSSSRFVLSDTFGPYHSFTSAHTVANNTTTQMGVSYKGTTASPDLYWNTYWAAERVWRETFNYVGVLQDGMTNVDIRGFNDNMPSFIGSCPSSCASSSPLRVQLDGKTGTGLSPQGRMMHELGHIASDVEQAAFKVVKNYCWPDTAPVPPATSCTWAPTTKEWGTDAFEEAFATLGANVTLWDGSATNPTSCISSGTCFSFGSPKSGTNIEASSFPHTTNNCVTNEGRWPLSHMRFMWDVYDWHNDADGDTIQEGSDCFWCLFTNLHGYAAGTGSDQVNEPWYDSTLTTIDNYDGRGSISYGDNYYTSFSKYLGTLRADNCYPQ